MMAIRATDLPLDVQARLGITPKKRPKYGAKPVNTEEGRFDSKREYAAWGRLKMELHAVEIIGLARQVRFRLPGCEYIADFVAIRPDRSIRVIDAKGVKTQTYRLKKRLMKEIHGITIEEV